MSVSTEKIEKVNINYGLELARMLMCFVVILCHFWNEDTYNTLLKPFLWLRPLTVPVFMTMSFLLVGRQYFKNPKNNIKKRLLRLMTPHIIWAVIYWSIYLMMGISNSISELFWQITTGHSEVLNSTMWFQVVMIGITVLFFGIFIVLPDYAGIIIVIILGGVSLLFQYSGLNYMLFSNMRYELSYSLGRFVEMIPYASLGICLSYYHVYERVLKYRWWLIIGATVVFCLLIFKPIPLDAPGYGYSGINNMLKGLAIVTIAYLLPVARLPELWLKVIKVFTRHTFGIYCMHRLIAQLLSTMGITRLLSIVLNVSESSFQICIILYVVCYLISTLIALVPMKCVTQLVN